MVQYLKYRSVYGFLKHECRVSPVVRLRSNKPHQARAEERDNSHHVQEYSDFFTQPPRDKKTFGKRGSTDIENVFSAGDPQVLTFRRKHPTLLVSDARNRGIWELALLDVLLDRSVKLLRGGLQIINELVPMRKDNRAIFRRFGDQKDN